MEGNPDVRIHGAGQDEVEMSTPSQPPSSPSVVDPKSGPADWRKPSTYGHFQDAEFVVSPKNWKAWLGQQIVGINLANVALLLTIIAISANIGSQLDQQRAYAIQSQRQIDALKAMIEPANAIAVALEAKSDLVARYNATLDRALSLGFSNITGQLSDLATDVNGVRMHVLAPIGSVLPFAGSVVPANFLPCDGGTLLVSEYPELFLALGSVYGGGDGVTTFRAPDLRGRVAVGMDAMAGSSTGAADRVNAARSAIAGATLGAVGGQDSVLLQTGHLPGHTHSGTTAGPSVSLSHSHSTAFGLDAGVVNGHVYAAPSGSQTLYMTSTGYATGESSAINLDHTHTLTSACDGCAATAFTNMPPAIVLMYIIRAK